MHDPSQPSSSPSRPGRGLATGLAFFLPVLGFHLWLEFRSQGMHGVDGYYHIKLARLYLSGELPFFGEHFPWMTQSVWRSSRCDWQAGYHVLLMPFTWMGLILGGKLSAAFFASVIPLSVFSILRLERVRLAWLFAGLLCVASEYYLVRVHLPRPTSPVVALLLFSAYFAAKGRNRAFLITCTLALATYCVPHNAGAVTAAAVAVLFLVKRRVPVRLLLAGGLALVLGVLSNPGFWSWRGAFFGTDHALFEVWEQMGGSLQAAKDGDRIRIDDRWVTLQAPAEFQPPTSEEVLGSFGIPLFVLLAAWLLLARSLRTRGLDSVRRLSAAYVAALLASLYFVLFLSHIRFAEYWIPFACLAAGLASVRGGWADDDGAPRSLRASLGRAGGLLLLLGACVSIWRVPTVIERTVETLEGETGIGLEYEAPMRWIAEHTAEDAVIFHARWPQFSPMFHFNHRNRYLIGLDPYFFYQHDPLAYERWIRVSEGELGAEETLSAIRGFEARHALVKRDSALDRVLRRSNALPTYEDATFRIYDVGPGSPDSPR